MSVCVCAVFSHVKQWCSCQPLGFLTCALMLMHAAAHGGCMDTVRESALEGDSEKKISCRTRELYPHQSCAQLVCWMLCQLSYPLANKACSMISKPDCDEAIVISRPYCNKATVFMCSIHHSLPPIMLVFMCSIHHSLPHIKLVFLCAVFIILCLTYAS